MVNLTLERTVNRFSQGFVIQLHYSLKFVWNYGGFQGFWRDPLAIKAGHFTHRRMVHLLPRNKEGMHRYSFKFLSVIIHIKWQHFLISRILVLQYGIQDMCTIYVAKNLNSTILAFPFSLLCRWTQLLGLWKGAHGSPSRAWTWVCPSLSSWVTWRWREWRARHRRRDTSLQNSKGTASPPHTCMHPYSTLHIYTISYVNAQSRTNK